MLRGQSKRISPKIHAEDLEIYSALKSIEDYAPANPVYTLTAMDTRHTKLLSARDALAAAEGAVAAARDQYVATQWEMHNGVLGVKDQAIAQFGVDSDEVQILKLKKKSDYKRRSTKKQPKTPTP